MDDYISREDAIKAIKESFNQSGTRASTATRMLIDAAFLQARSILCDLPAADVVEVVRCKSCKHRPISKIEGKNYGFSLEPPDDDWRCPCLNDDDGWYSWMPEDDFYCAYGERRTEDG